MDSKSGLGAHTRLTNTAARFTFCCIVPLKVCNTNVQHRIRCAAPTCDTSVTLQLCNTRREYDGCAVHSTTAPYQCARISKSVAV